MLESTQEAIMDLPGEQWLNWVRWVATSEEFQAPLGLEKILNSSPYVGLRTWKNSEISLDRAAMGETRSEVRCELSYTLRNSEKFRAPSR